MDSVYAASNRKFIIMSNTLPYTHLQDQSEKDLLIIIINKLCCIADNNDDSTWTPTMGALSNVTTTSATVSQYSRRGNMFFASGAFSITPTAPGLVEVSMTLPPGITSNFTAASQVGGSSVAVVNTNRYVLAAYADSATDKIHFRGYVTFSGSSETMYFNLSGLINE